MEESYFQDEAAKKVYFKNAENLYCIVKGYNKLSVLRRWNVDEGMVSNETKLRFCT